MSQGVVHDPIDLAPTYEDDGETFPQPKFFLRLKMSNEPTLDPKNYDFDGDGLSSWEELNEWGTDPLKKDSNGDGIPDGQTDSHGDGMADEWKEMLILQLGDPNITDISQIDLSSDSDGDGVLDHKEYQLGLSGYRKDSSGDGFSDFLSINQAVHLKLDEAGGSTAADSSPAAQHGQLLGSPTWQPTEGIRDGALDFAGGSDGVDLPAAVLDQCADLTLSLWFKSQSIALSQSLLSAANASQANEFGVHLEQTNEASDTIRVDVGGGESVSWPLPRSLADGLWHHLVIVRDSGSSEVALYLDGAWVSNRSTPPMGLLDVEAATLAQKHTGVANYDTPSAFIGQLDACRIYTVALDESHALELFKPNDLDLDGLPDDWEMDLFDNLATLAAAADDLDGDGATNRMEFEAGTDPNDYYNSETPVVQLIDGAGQEIFNGQRTSDPLVFKVTSDGTTPLVGAPVTLEHLEISEQLGRLGSVESLDGDQLASSLILTTDSNGEVAVYFKAD